VGRHSLAVSNKRVTAITVVGASLAISVATLAGDSARHVAELEKATGGGKNLVPPTPI